MKPLIYLSSHTIVNAIRRTIRTPARLIGTLALIAYWASLIVTRGFSGTRRMPRNVEMPQLNLPAADLLYLGLFLVFLMIFFFRSLAMFTPPGRYKPSDADVLFPTPISPKLVMLHRFVSDLLLTMFIPLFVYFIVSRSNDGSISQLVKMIDSAKVGNRESGSVFVAFSLVSLFTVSLSFAVGMAINRDSSNSIMLKRMASVICTLFFGAIGYLIVSSAFAEAPMQALISVSKNLWVRIACFPATAAAEYVVSPLNGESGFAWGFGLILGSAALLAAATLQANHLYDMAARRSIPNRQAREAARTGDSVANWARAAREGRLGARRWRLISNLRLTKVWALLWRDLVLQYRLFLWIFLPVAAVLIVAAALPLFEDEVRSAVWMTTAIGVLGMIPMIVPAITQAGFQESLKRVDVLKPLPFSMPQICLFESIAKSVSSVIVVLFVSAFLLVMRPEKWQEAVAVVIAIPPVCVLSANICWISTLLFPDLSDPAQRFLRGIALLAGFAAIYLPGGLIIWAGYELHASAIIIAVFIGALSVGLCIVASNIAAPLLTRFNPAD